jgi:hypothetical protein
MYSQKQSDKLSTEDRELKSKRENKTLIVD